MKKRKKLVYKPQYKLWKILKIKPFQFLLRNAPFCSLGEVGGRATEKSIDSCRSSADSRNGRRTRIALRNWLWYNFLQYKPINWNSDKT